MPTPVIPCRRYTPSRGPFAVILGRTVKLLFAPARSTVSSTTPSARSSAWRTSCALRTVWSSTDTILSPTCKPASRDAAPVASSKAATDTLPSVNSMPTTSPTGISARVADTLTAKTNAQITENAVRTNTRLILLPSVFLMIATQLIFLGLLNVTDTNVEKTGCSWRKRNFLKKDCQGRASLVR